MWCTLYSYSLCVLYGGGTFVSVVWLVWFDGRSKKVRCRRCSCEWASCGLKKYQPSPCALQCQELGFSFLLWCLALWRIWCWRRWDNFFVSGEMNKEMREEMALVDQNRRQFCHDDDIKNVDLVHVYAILRCIVSKGLIKSCSWFSHESRSYVRLKL